MVLSQDQAELMQADRGMGLEEMVEPWTLDAAHSHPRFAGSRRNKEGSSPFAAWAEVEEQ